MKYCSKCKLTKPLDQYRRSSRNKDGLQGWCNECSARVSSEWFARNRDKRLLQQRERYTQISEDFQAWKASKGCFVCGESEPVCLDLHHLDPAKKRRHCVCFNDP